MSDSAAGIAVCLGSREFLELRGYTAPVEEGFGGAATISATVSSGDAIVTHVWVGWGGSIRGRIALSDVVRSDAADIIGWLHAQGIDVWMVTGDNEAAAHAVAAAVEIPRERVIANLFDLLFELRVVLGGLSTGVGCEYFASGLLRRRNDRFGVRVGRSDEGGE